MAFPIAALLLSLASSAISYATAPIPENAKAGRLQDSVEAEDGKPIPVVFGENHIENMNVLAMVDLSTREIIANGGK